MKKLNAFLLFLVCSFSNLQAQTIGWETQIQTGSVNSMKINAEFKDLFIAPDKKIYGTGYFSGNKAQFGTISVYADSSDAPDPLNGVRCFTSFISCQDSAGTFLWIKVITSDQSVAAWDWSSGNSGQKIVQDSNGDLYVAGSIYGDTVRLENQTLYAADSSHVGLYLLKISSGGSLIWSRFFRGRDEPSEIMGGWKGMQFRNGKLELIAENRGLRLNGSIVFPSVGTAVSGHPLGKLQISPSGGLIGTSSFYFTSPEFSGGTAWVCKFLPDGKLLVGSSDPVTYKGAYVSLLDSNLQTESRFHIRTVDNSGISPFPVVPYEIISLPGGGYGAYFGVLSTMDPSTNYKLVVNSDTLSIPWLSGVQNGLFVKLSTFSCMKSVRVFPHTGISNGEFLMDQNYVSLTGFGTPAPGHNLAYDVKLLLHNRNGSLVDVFASAKQAICYAESNTPAGTPINMFHFRALGNKILCAVGRHIFQWQYSSINADDSSFAGCLSDRNLVLSSTKHLSSTFGLVANPVSDYLVLSGNPTSGIKAEILNVLGQKMTDRSIPDQGKMYVGNLPAGVYLLHLLEPSGFRTTIRFQKL